MTKITTIPNTKFVIVIEFARIVKPAYIFEYFNQFLVWIAQKILALSNFDLLIIEYYKKRLETQLKKKWIYTNNYILIELTKLTGLQLPTNWTSSKNHSPANLFSLIPLTSPLSLLSSINFSTFFAACHKPY